MNDVHFEGGRNCLAKCDTPCRRYRKKRGRWEEVFLSLEKTMDVIYECHLRDAVR